MTIKLHTYDIQKLVLCTILAEPDSVVTREDQERLADILGDINALCKEDNDYTVTITVS